MGYPPDINPYHLPPENPISAVSRHFYYDLWMDLLLPRAPAGTWIASTPLTTKKMATAYVGFLVKYCRKSAVLVICRRIFIFKRPICVATYRLESYFLRYRWKTIMRFLDLDKMAGCGKMPDVSYSFRWCIAVIVVCLNVFLWWHKSVITFFVCVIWDISHITLQRI